MREVGDAGSDCAGGEPRSVKFDIDLEIPSDVRYIERVVEIVTKHCEELSYTQRQCRLNVPVALTEALSNAILRGNGDNSEKHVRVRAHFDDRVLVMEVGDEGTGFDLDACTADPTAPENLSKEDGRGLFIMRRLMNSVERYMDGGNVVRLTLHRE
jgi:serine/threonine-protein kinase RsbW